MMDYRCKCGNSTGFGSMPFPPCTVCDDCGSTLATSPDTHAEPEPHDWQTRYHDKTGKPYEMCRLCMKRRGYEEAKKADAPPAAPIP